MVRIFIENQELDVKDDFSHQITYAVDDLKNLDSKSTAFSKTIVLPGTANNNRLLGNIFEFSNSNYNTAGSNVGYNFNAAKSAKARLEVNGLTIIKGVMRLLEIIIDDKVVEYEVAIFGELGGLFNKLGTSKLEDLDFSQYDHTYNVTNIKASWNISKDFIRVNSGANTTFSGNLLKVVGYNFANVEAGDTINIYVAFPTSNNGDYTVSSVYYDSDNIITYIYMTTNFPSNFTGVLSVTITLKNKRGIGYYYPLIDYGNVSTNKKDYQYKAFRPALFVKEIMSKIIKSAGYTWQSDFFNTNFFTRLIIPNNQKDLQSYKTRAFFSNNLYSNSVNGTIGDFIFYNPILNSFTTSDNIIFTYTGSSATFNASIQTTLSIGLGGGVTVPNTVGFKFRLRKNSTNIYTDSEFTYYTFNSVTERFNFAVNVQQEITLNTNDTIQMYFFTDKTIQFSYWDLTNSTNVVLNSQIPLVLTLNLNDTISMNGVIPLNILQKDFFSSILKMFNLMVIEDKDVEKKLIIEPWVDFYDLDRTTYLDWSDKIDRSQVIKIKPMSEINSRYYQIKYKSENDYYNELYKKKYNEGYGDVNFDNALEFAKDASTTEVIFSATPLVGYVGESKVVPTIMKWDGKTAGTNEESVTSNIRIMQAKEVSGVTSWNILNGATVLASGTTYGYAGHLDNPDAPAADLNFGAVKELYFTLAAGALQNNLFNAYYSSYLAEITDKDSRLVTAKIKLTEQDIFNLDFGRFIFFDGVLYRLQRIVDYSAGDICTVELLRVIYTQY